MRLAYEVNILSIFQSSLFIVSTLARFCKLLAIHTISCFIPFLGRDLIYTTCSYWFNSSLAVSDFAHQSAGRAPRRSGKFRNKK